MPSVHFNGSVMSDFLWPHAHRFGWAPGVGDGQHAAVHRVAKSRTRLRDWTELDCSRPGLPVHHQLLELTQTHVHRVGDAIQPTYPLLSPSPPAFNLSQHQGVFQWVSSSHQLAKVREFQLQHQPFQWKFRTHFLYNWLDGSPCSTSDSQRSSPTPQFSFLYSPALTSIHENQ